MNASPLTEFANDQSGTIAVVGALSMLMLLGAVGAAMTSAVVYHEQSEYQRSLDAAVLSAASIPGDIKLTFDGVLYFPTQDVWIGGGSVINAKSPSYVFVAEKIWFQDNTVVEVWQENSRGLDLPAPSASITRGPQLLN